MSIDLLLIIIALVVLFVASITDLKTKEVPDRISYGFIILALLIRFVYSFYSDFSYFLYGLMGLGIMFVFGAAMYYSKQWGGADAKLFMGLGATFGGMSYQQVPLLLILVILVFFVGAIYAMIWAIYLFCKDFKVNSKSFLIKVRKYRRYRYISLGFALLFLIVIFFIQNTITLILFIVSILAFFLTLFIAFLRVVENKSFTKKVPVSKLTEGDWLAEDVRKNNKLICSKKHACIDKKQIEKLKRNKIKTVWITEGIPFVPAIFLGLLLTVILFF